MIYLAMLVFGLPSFNRSDINMLISVFEELPRLVSSDCNFQAA